MSARREHRLRNLERRVEELEAEQAARGYLRANVEEMREKLMEFKFNPTRTGKAVPMDAWWTRTPSTRPPRRSLWQRLTDVFRKDD